MLLFTGTYIVSRVKKVETLGTTNEITGTLSIATSDNHELADIHVRRYDNTNSLHSLAHTLYQRNGEWLARIRKL